MNKIPNPGLIDAVNPDLTDEWFKQAKPFAALPACLQAKLHGRSQAATTKEPIKTRLDAWCGAGLARHGRWLANAHQRHSACLVAIGWAPGLSVNR